MFGAQGLAHHAGRLPFKVGLHIELVRSGPLHHHLAQALGAGDEDHAVGRPDSVSRVNMTPEAAKSERTMRCTPAESATPLWS